MTITRCQPFGLLIVLLLNLDYSDLCIANGTSIAGLSVLNLHILGQYMQLNTCRLLRDGSTESQRKDWGTIKAMGKMEVLVSSLKPCLAKVNDVWLRVC